MTINPYGIGAGTSIAREIDGDDESERQAVRRKRMANRASEQEFARRLSAERVQSAEFAPIASRQMPTPAQFARERINSNVQGRKKKELDSLSTTDDVGSRQAIQTTEQQAISMMKADLRQPECAESISRKLVSIIQGLSGLSMKAKEEAVLRQLQDLQACFESPESMMTSSEEVDQATGYLEFLAGYFEVDTRNSAPTRKIFDAVQGLQAQMAQIAEALQIAVSGSLPGASLPSIRTASLRSLYLQRNGLESASGSDKPSSRKDADGDDSSPDSALLMSMANRGGASVPRPDARGRNRSSQERDAEKRRDETVAGVTLRSV